MKQILELKLTVDEMKQFPGCAPVWKADNRKFINLKIDP